MFKNPFSFVGRIRRTEYGVSIIIYSISYTILVLLLALTGMDEDALVVLSYVCLIPFLWFLYAQGAKRCHDLGHSGWWQLIPFYGLWMLFQDGQLGENEYGENPKNNSNTSNF